MNEITGYYDNDGIWHDPAVEGEEESFAGGGRGGAPGMDEVCPRCGALLQDGFCIVCGWPNE